MELIIVKSRLDPKTYYRINLRIYFGPRLFITAIVMLAAMNAVAFWNTPFYWTGEYVFIGVIIFWLGIVRPVMLYYRGSKAIKKILAPPYDVIYTINNENITSETGESSSQISWKFITKAVEKSDYFLLHSSANTYRYLPKSGFATAADTAALKDIVRHNHIKAYFIN